MVLDIIIMAQFSKEELSFVEDLPKHVEIECPVCLNVLTDPYIVSCCGYNFCGSCFEIVKASINGSCPMCKEKEYQAIPDKKCSRIINGLEVYCSNKEKGCQWKGELKNISTHRNKEKREGECQYEEVKCRYKKCRERKQRRYLKDHEDNKCLQRPFECQYCKIKHTFVSITEYHYDRCRQYPVTCPKKCSSTTMPRYKITENIHINECPLEPVDCVFSWAGCNDKPLRKDVHVHTADTKHMTLLAVACGQLKKENEEMKKEIRENNDKIKEAKKEIEKLRNIPTASLLPIDVTVGGEAVHFYTGACGQHMSARLMLGYNELLEYSFILFAFHEGQFDEYLPKSLKIFGKLTYKAITWPTNRERDVKVDTDVPLLGDTESTYQPLPHDILNGIISCEGTLPQGVIKIELARHMTFMIDTATIYT
uniref:RING-type domain-containing protein n=1 Tax=Amphimedon queenslandica TaxID=400682 RepID=A0A1X7UIU8_AMPQE